MQIADTKQVFRNMEGVSCLYHKDKNEFSSIQKELQKSGWIPRKYVHRLAMAVCSCRKNKGDFPDRSKLLCDKEALQMLIEEQRNNLPKNLITFLDRYLNTAIETDYSSCQFIAVLVMAKHGNFSMLERAALSTNSKVSERDLQREINRKKKLTTHQIEMIKIKKKRKMDSCVMKLPVFPGNFPKMKLDFPNGIKGFIEPQFNLNNKNFDDNKAETYVRVWGDASNLKTLNQRLTEEARNVQKQVDDERRARKERKAKRCHYYACLYDSEEEDFEETVMLGHVKEHLTDDFSLKVQKAAKSKSKAVLLKAQTSVLDGGHCLQCFKSFSDLHDKTPCTFHKGYAVSQELSNKRLWSCCSLEVEEDMDSFTLHSTTGCSSSRVHNWRTHAKAKGKVRENQFYNTQIQ